MGRHREEELSLQLEAVLEDVSRWTESGKNLSYTGVLRSFVFSMMSFLRQLKPSAGGGQLCLMFSRR